MGGGGSSPRVATRSSLAATSPVPLVPSLRSLLSRRGAGSSTDSDPFDHSGSNAVDAEDLFGLPEHMEMPPLERMAWSSYHRAGRNSGHPASWSPAATAVAATSAASTTTRPSTTTTTTNASQSVLESVSTSARQTALERSYRLLRPASAATSTSRPAPAPPLRQNPYRVARRRTRSNKTSGASTTSPVPPEAATAGTGRQRRSVAVATSTRTLRPRKRAMRPDSGSNSNNTGKRKRTTSSSTGATNNRRRKPPPNAKIDEDYDIEETANKKTCTSKSANKKSAREDGAPSPACCICMCEPSKDALSKIDGCEHRFCFTCIGKWADRENTCPLCKERFTRIERVNKVRGKKGVSNTKRVKQRDQRADLVAAPALEGLIASIAANGSLPGGARLGRLFIGGAAGSFGVGFGNGLTISGISSGIGSPTRSRSSARLTFSLEEPPFVDLDGDDDDSFGSSFDVNAFMRNTLQSAITATVNRNRAAQQQRRNSGGTSSSSVHDSSRVAAPFAAPWGATMPPPPPLTGPETRSYASNSADQSAGRASDNPLEIDDDTDDGGDDDVQVLQVTRSSSR